jgi:long-chain fatty acid transport protein
MEGRMMTRAACRAGAVLAGLGLVAVVPRPATASGFYIAQQGVEGIGRAKAGNAAVVRDASTVFTNPAGLTALKAPQIVAGISSINPNVRIDNQGSTAATPGTLGAAAAYSGSIASNSAERALVPNAYLACPMPGDRLWLGLGISAPWGLSTHAPRGWFGRYDSVRTSLATVDIAPSAAVRITDALSIGAGIDIQYATATLSSAIPDPLAPGGPSASTDGRNRLQGDDWATGFNIGVLVTPRTDTRIGVHYRSAITQRLDGRYEVSDLSGPLAGFNGSFAAHADLALPDIVSVAVAHDVSPALTLLVEYQWFNWSRFSEVQGSYAADQPDIVIPQGYRDSSAVSVGAEYAWSEKLTLRGGFRYEQTPTRNRYRTTSVPEGDNYSVGLGLSYTLGGGVVLSLGAFATVFEDAPIDLDRTFFAGTPAESRVAIRGDAEMVSTSLVLGFSMAF